MQFNMVSEQEILGTTTGSFNIDEEAGFHIELAKATTTRR
jgi:hypothetical protein